jgi:hypothetical protein
MILKITTVLFLIHSLDMLSRLLARRRDMFWPKAFKRGATSRASRSQSTSAISSVATAPLAPAS